MNKWRYERKFLVPNCSVEEVVLELKLRLANFSEIYWKRRVNSLYLDTEELDYAYENFEGTPTKTKIRIRWYGDDLQKAVEPKLEIKAKAGSIGTKMSFDLPSLDLSHGLSELALRDYIAKSSLPDEQRIKINLLKPALITSYNRRYFHTFDDILRVTTDFDLAFYRPDILAKYTPFNFENAVIMELKYDKAYDLNARNLVSKLPYRLDRFSKYVNGLKVVWGH
jgi:SPX domain protein involved in polyphosphate accumulation